MYLYLEPPGGAVVRSIDEKTRIQALDRTQPMLPIEFDVTEKRTHDYVGHGTTNLFAALNVDTGEVFGECKPTRGGTQPARALTFHPQSDTHATPLTWTAAADEILAKVQLAQTNIKKLVNNNAK
jgi:hypothetical protein